MDEQTQKRRIITRLTTRDLPDPSGLHEPWSTIFSRLRPVTCRSDAVDALRRATEGLPQRETLLRDLVALLPEDPAFRPFPTLADLGGDLPATSWLWPNWIPRRNLTLFVADPGAGKTMVALELAGRVIAGAPFPGQADPGEPAPTPPGRRKSMVLIVDAEAAPEVQNERATALGIDPGGLALFLPPEPGAGIDLTRTAQARLLRRMCAALRPELLIVDSLSSAAPQIEQNQSRLRALLAFAHNLAWEHDMALLLVHHLRKRSGHRQRPVSLADVRGSSVLTALARSVLALSVVQPGPDAPRRLEVIKANLCQAPPPLGVVFEATGHGAPAVRYTEPPEPPRTPSQVDLCAEWILDLLRDAREPLRPKDVYALARDAGFSTSTAYRARRALGHRIQELAKSPRDPTTRWTLAGWP